MSTRVCLAVTALRRRVSMSAIGSVIFGSLSVQIPDPKSQMPTNPNTGWALGFGVWDLPRALGHSRDVAFQRRLAEAEPAHRELAHVGARAAAQLAAVAQPDLV